MAERIVGLGLANIDLKIRNGSSLELPKERHELVPFFQKEIVAAGKEYHTEPGGSVPILVATTARLDQEDNFKLFCAVGNDYHGFLYSAATPYRLGIPQIIRDGQTGSFVSDGER